VSKTATAKAPSLRALVVSSYALAGLNFALTHPDLSSAFYARHMGALDALSGPLGTVSFLLWCSLIGYAFRRFRRKAWPVLIGAPFALATFLALLYYGVAASLFDHP
jgi:hypothetical protein